jgi:hypothetical protein
MPNSRGYQDCDENDRWGGFCFVFRVVLGWCGLADDVLRLIFRGIPWKSWSHNSSLREARRYRSAEFSLSLTVYRFSNHSLWSNDSRVERYAMFQVRPRSIPAKHGGTVVARELDRHGEVLLFIMWNNVHFRERQNLADDRQAMILKAQANHIISKRSPPGWDANLLSVGRNTETIFEKERGILNESKD